MRVKYLLLYIFLFAFNPLHAQYSVWTWGSREDGQRGDDMRDVGSSIPLINTVPAPVTCYGDWVEISAGSSGVLALRQDGTLWSWGTTRGLGLTDQQLDVDGTPSTLPSMDVAAQIGSAQDWASMSHKGNVSAAIKTDGTLWMWGANTVGELGNGTSTVSNLYPTLVGSATNWKQVVTGFTTLAIQTDGTLWSWGAGALRGVSTDQDANVPTRVGTDTDWRVLADLVTLASHAAAIKTDGSLWTWGDNTYGQLGLGSHVNTLIQQRVGTDTDWKSVSVGSDYTVAIKNDGSLWAWGRNNQGQLGDGTNTDHPTPVRIGTATDWKEASAGRFYALAVKADGSLWAWGSTIDNTMVYTTTPQRIGTSNAWKHVRAGADFGVALNDSPHHPVPSPVYLGNDVNRCGEHYVITPNVTNADLYKWSEVGSGIWSSSPGGSGEYVADRTGTYRCVMTVSGCRTSDEIQVSLHNVPQVSLSIQGQEIPNCTFGRHFEIGSTVTFTNTTADVASHPFRWELEDNDGTVATGTGNSRTITFTDEGTFVFKFITTSPCEREGSSGLLVIQPKLSLGDAVVKSCQAQVNLSSNITDGNSYTWLKPDNTQVPGQSIAADQSGIYTLSMDRVLCVQKATVRVDLSGTKTLDFNPGGTALVNCSGQLDQADPVTFENTTSEADGKDFTWTLGDGTTFTGVSPVHTYAAPGHYTVKLDGSCNRTLSKEIYVQPKLSLGDDLFACEPSVPLSANIPGADSYSWETPGGTITGEQAITASSPGTYGVTVINLGCTQTDQLMITTSPFAVNTNFDILAAGERIASDGIVVNGVPLTFMASGSTDLQRTWTLGDGTTATEQTLQHTYASAGDFTVTLTVTDNAGCAGSAEKYLHIQDIIITDAISPNGDGKNDRLVITPFLYGAELKVMDRAGRTVYEASPYNNDFSGQNLESDVYYYELQLKEVGKSYKGYVHIVK